LLGRAFQRLEARSRGADFPVADFLAVFL